MKPKELYAVWIPGNRVGEFEFLCSTQSNLTKSKEKAIKEAKELLKEYQMNFDPPLSVKEALEELGGKPVVYKLILEKVKYD